jgi:exonuclease SbcC
MIPKYLKIKGLYSYQKEQEIHFDALTDASLFGIFGAVGSGKSSILEAITFALYGDTERLNRSGDDRTYNMMNLRSDELLIDFECVAGKSGGLYKFTVKGKRNSKNFKEVKTFDRRAYRWQNDAWVPLSESETTESIIGLSYDNFRRTIIIPQGRFQEFIELRDAERTRMMKELFQLEKYDLSRNVGVLSKRNDLAISGIGGQLLGLGEVTPEIIALEEKQRDIVKQEINLVQQELLANTSLDTQMQRRKLTFEKTLQLQTQLLSLESKQVQMADREKALSVFEICSIHFKSLLDRKKSLDGDRLRYADILRANKLKSTTLSGELAAVRERLDQIQPRFEKRELLLDTADELEKVITIKNNMRAAERNRAALASFEDELKQRESELELLRKQRLEKEAENDTRKATLTDVTELSLVKTWFATFDEIQLNKNQVLKEGKSLKEEIEIRKNNLAEMVMAAKSSFGLHILPEGGLTVVQNSIQDYLDANELKRENLAKNAILIATRIELQQYANSLSDGEPCPLCGSEHHPAVLHTDTGLSEEVQESKKQEAQLLQLDKGIRQFLSKVEKDFVHIESLEKQIGTFRDRYKDIVDRLDRHNKEFIWTRFDRDYREQFERHFNAVDENQREIRKNDAAIKKLSELIEQKTLEKAEKIEKPLQNLRNENLKIENTISTLTAQLQRVKWNDVGIHDPDMVLGEIVRLKVEYEEVTKVFEKTVAAIDVLEKEKDILSGSEVTLLTALETVEKELVVTQTAIDAELVTQGFDSEGRVVEILEKPFEINTEKKVLEEFKLALHNTRRDLETLRQENDDTAYSPDAHEAVSKAIEVLTAKLNVSRKEEGRLEGQLKMMAENLEKKGVLLSEQMRLQVRKEHLDDLARLFRSSGFVDYASSIYLQNLIQAANHRFHQMTHQQLHLELGEGNSFWVRDLLNGGHMRLLKTLSGGQKFQAALSLALALADHIHIRNESVHNFFFLDEGFGSLDKNALQTVFETLKSLRKENRIVGIISHVEDLQQEIQTYLKIEETPEGSRVVASWKS